MHIVDGVLSAPVLIGATLLAAGGVGVGLRRLTPERMPEAALLTSLFFVASLVHVPVGPVSAHLGLTGLLGLLMGWGAFPALLVGLTLQAVFFGYGGLTALGVNTLVMALPPVLIAALAARIPGQTERATALRGFLVGSLAVLGSALLMVLVLVASDGRFTAAAQWALLGHIPVMLVEGAVTAAAAVFLHKVRPELLIQANGVTQQGDAGGSGFQPRPEVLDQRTEISAASRSHGAPHSSPEGTAGPVVPVALEHGAE